MKLLLRILAMPFVFGIIFIHCNYTAIKRTRLFLRYGGEWIAYDKEKATIGEIYDELKAERAEKQPKETISAPLPESSANAMQGEGEEDGYSKFKYMVLRGKEHGNVFWTSGHTYRTDWYELLFETDDDKEAQAEWEKYYTNAGAREVRSAEEILYNRLVTQPDGIYDDDGYNEYMSHGVKEQYIQAMTEYANQFK